MRLFLICASFVLCLCAAQDLTHDQVIPSPPTAAHEADRRLPNGKSQNEEIIKADYEKSMRDARQLVELSQNLEADLEKETSHVLSLGDLKKLDEIERIAKRMRGRIRRF